MPEPPTNSEPVVYQLRGVSPLIWRRLLVRSDSTIADLHASFQRVLGWTDEHLNRFVIHGREYGVWHDGGIGFRDNPRHVRLADLGLRVVHLLRWLKIDRFDRRAANRELARVNRKSTRLNSSH